MDPDHHPLGYGPTSSCDAAPSNQIPGLIGAEKSPQKWFFHEGVNEVTTATFLLSPQHAMSWGQPAG